MVYAPLNQVLRSWDPRFGSHGAKGLKGNRNSLKLWRDCDLVFESLYHWFVCKSVDDIFELCFQWCKYIIVTLTIIFRIEFLNGLCFDFIQVLGWLSWLSVECALKNFAIRRLRSYFDLWISWCKGLHTLHNILSINNIGEYWTMYCKVLTIY